MSSREHYVVNATSLAELVTTLNFVLARIADRVDKMEGVRGIPTFESDIDLQSNRITDAGQAVDNSDGVVLSQLPGQDLDTSDGPTFAALTVTGDAVIGDEIAVGGDAAFSANVTVAGNLEVTSNLTVSGTVTVQVTSILTDDIKVKDSNGTVIHSFEVGA